MPSPQSSRLRLRTAFHLAVAVGTVASVLAVTPGSTAAASLLGPEGGTYEATITRTEYGIPHIEAQDYGSLGFGQGYGAAEDIICSLADTMVTVRGERSKYFGPDETYNDQVTLNATNLQTDALFTDIINREVVEDLLASDDPGVAPGDEVRAMVKGYVTGINQYLEDVGGADGIDDPACKGAEWVQPATEMDLWRGIHAALLLASTGVFVPEIVGATPPSPEDPGLPDPPVAGASFTPLPDVPLADAAAALDEALGRGEHGFGSNGTALSGDVTATGRGMLLGNPHFPWQNRYRFTQTQLTIPGEYDVRGGMLHGSPVVNIGWTEDVAWTHTVSTAYRFTPYEYKLVPGMPTQYVTEDGIQDLEHRTVEIELPDGTTTTEDLYRTNEGYVVDDQAGRITQGLLTWTASSVWAIRDANAEHLKVLDVFHEMAKAGNVEELHAAHAATGGMPWVNTMAADRDGNVLYADASVVPHVSDDKVQQCATTPIGRALFEAAGLPGLDGTFAQSTCAWGTDENAARAGMFGEANLPDTLTLPEGVEDPTWVINANDSYWLPNPDTPLTGFARIIGCEECERSLRTRMVYRYVMDRLDGSDGLGGDNVFTHDQLMEVETINRVFAGELAREGDALQNVCSSTPGLDPSACEALANWDGMTNIDSTGAHLFREFWTRTNADTRWLTPFDASDPVGTPNTLNPADPQNQQAMNDAVAFLDGEGVAYDAALGDVQKAGDEGAGDISIHGGFGSTGNANVIAISDPTANDDVLYPVSYGSSHIQAVAFTDDGVDGCTILTYGQSYDITSDHHDDQTELWEGEEWVCWPDDVAAAAITTKTVTGQVPGGDAAPAGDDDQLASTGGGSAAVLGGLLLAGAALWLWRRRDED